MSTMNEILDHLHRIFLGENSLWYLFEVAFRTSFIFSYTLLLLRFMGKRGMGQLTPFEFAIIVALGSAVGDPMFYDDVPLLHTMLVIAIVIGLHRFLSLITQKNEAVEKFMEGETAMLINRGEILLETLFSERLSREELFEMLRVEWISQLGEVRQAFLEPSGNLAVIRWEPSRSGLSILPLMTAGITTKSRIRISSVAIIAEPSKRINPYIINVVKKIKPATGSQLSANDSHLQKSRIPNQ